MNKPYNDGLNNETEVQIISTYRRENNQHKDIINDLGTLINVEMYSNSNYKEKENLKKNTFQQTYAANVGGEAPVMPSAAPSAPLVRRPSASKTAVMSVNGSTTNNQISKDDVYHNITVQMGKIKIGKRANRVDVYPAFMRDTDKTYKIKLSCDATDQLHELVRGAQRRTDKRGKVIKENKYILDLVEQYRQENVDGIMMGRLRYRAGKNFTAEMTKRNLPYALLVLIPYHDTFLCRIHLYTEVYDILLDDDITTEQEKFYVLSGTYTEILEDLEETNE